MELVSKYVYMELQSSILNLLNSQIAQNKNKKPQKVKVNRIKGCFILI